MLSIPAIMMATSWGVDPMKVSDDTPLTRWIEEQLDFMARKFDVDMPDVDVIECPAGYRAPGKKRTMAVGGLGRNIEVIAVAADVLDEYSTLELHFIVRHEVAHIIDRQQRGTSDEDSPAFKSICEEINAPLSGDVTETRGKENAQECASRASMDVLEFVEESTGRSLSKGL